MTLTELLALHRVYMEAPSTVEWSDANLTLLLNEAYKHIINYLTSVDKFYQVSSTTIDVVSGTKTYTISVDFRKILKIISLTTLKEIDLIDVRQYPTDENILYPAYLVRGSASKTLNFFKDHQMTDTFTIYYAGQPAALTTANPEIPTNFHNLIVVYATILGKTIEGKDYARWQKLFDDGISAMLSTEFREEPCVGRNVKVLAEYF